LALPLPLEEADAFPALASAEQFSPDDDALALLCPPPIGTAENKTEQMFTLYGIVF
jgi:hypothetical protein